MLPYKSIMLGFGLLIAVFLGTSAIIVKHKKKANAPARLTAIFGIAARRCLTLMNRSHARQRMSTVKVDRPA
jgi:hypothetical protein